MRRFLLTLTVVSFAGWSQPTQPQPQPPIPVKIEMPTESIWTALLKLAIPTILGAALGSGITLYGLRQTNKHNAAENKANREHQFQVEIAKAEIAANHRSQDRRWEFRKDIYCNIVRSTLMVNYGYARVLNALPLLKDDNPDKRANAGRLFSNAQADVQQYGTEYMANAILAPLAMADDVARAVNATPPALPPIADMSDIDPTLLKNHIDQLTSLLGKLIDAGRKDLWGWEASEQEAKAEGAKQS